MRKTVFIVTEQFTSASERESKAVIQQRVTLWLKGALCKHTHDKIGITI